MEAAEWKQIIDINLTGLFYVAQAVCRQMLYVKSSGSKYGQQKWHGWRIWLCSLQLQ